MPIRNAFYSFHYEQDAWRASQVRNMKVLEGNQPARDNDWETIKRGGDAAIERWIKEQLNGRSVVIVLIGANTAGRKWINFEITEGWNQGKGLLGIYIDQLLDQNQSASSRGSNPFEEFNVRGVTLSSIVKAHVPVGYSSQAVYNDIKNRLSGWIEEAIEIRSRY